MRCFSIMCMQLYFVRLFLICIVLLFSDKAMMWCCDHSSVMGSTPPEKYKYRHLQNFLHSRPILVGNTHTVDILKGPTGKLGIKLKVLVSLRTALCMLIFWFLVWCGICLNNSDFEGENFDFFMVLLGSDFEVYNGPCT